MHVAHTRRIPGRVLLNGRAGSGVSMTAIVSFLFFTALVAVLSWWFTRHDQLDTATGYFLAGRSLTWVVIGGSLLLTNISTEQLVGLNGGAFKNGMEIIAWEMGAALAMLVMAIYCLPRYLQGGITTIPEYLEGRYDRLTRSFVSLLILVAVSISVMPFVLSSGALFMRDVFDVSTRLDISDQAGLWLMIVGIGVVGGIYAIFGGLRAVAISDTLNGTGLLVAGLLLPILGLMELGDGHAWDGWMRLQSTHRDRLYPWGDAASELPVGTLVSGVALLHLYYWCTNQYIVQRAFGASSLEQGQKGVLFAATLKLLGPFYLVLPGVMAFHLYRDEIDASGNLAYSTMVGHLLPKPLIGFFAAAIFGAILSTFNSALNSCSTLFSLDLYRGFLRPQASDRETVLVGKVFGTILAIAVIAATPAITGGGPVFNTMKQLAATFDIPLMVIVFVGLFSKRTSTHAAWVASLAGITFYSLVAIVWENRLFGHTIHWLHVAGLNFALMMTIVAIFRFVAPRPVPYQHVDARAVDMVHWRWAKPIAAMIAVGVVAIYAYLTVIGRT